MESSSGDRCGSLDSTIARTDFIEDLKARIAWCVVGGDVEGLSAGDEEVQGYVGGYSPRQVEAMSWIVVVMMRSTVSISDVRDCLSISTKDC